MSAPNIESGSADQQIASYVDRILRLREEADERMADVREVYAELKGEGFDKTVVGRLVAELRKRAKDGAAVDEADALLDTYRAAYHRAASHTHTREAA